MAQGGAGRKEMSRPWLAALGLRTYSEDALRGLRIVTMYKLLNVGKN